MEICSALTKFSMKVLYINIQVADLRSIWMAIILSLTVHHSA